MLFNKNKDEEDSATPKDSVSPEDSVTPENTAEQNDTQDGQQQENTEPAVKETVKPEKQPEPEYEMNDAKPRRQVSVFVAVVGMIVAAVLTCQITFIATKSYYSNMLAKVQTDKFGSDKLNEIYDIYKENFIGEIDDEKLTDGLIAGLIYGIGDKYGNYMSAEEYKDYVDSLNSTLDGGIGVSATHNTDYNAIEILRVYPDSPADAGGILEKDLIIAVNGVDVADAGYENAINNIRGEKGTDVTLTIRRGENYTDEISVKLTRASITVNTVSYKVIENIGVISISNFYADTPQGLKDAVEAVQSQGCDRLIFDVRYNSGGLLTSIEDVLDYLLPEGVVVRMKDAAGKETSYSSDASCINMPMTVLVNGSTASAAELFTSALMDFGKQGKLDVTVIGTQTYGKGTVTRPYMLNDGSVIYISYQLYYPPVSDNFEGVGITPDIVLELDEEAQKINFYKLTLENDNQLRKAVETVKSK